ncbi:MAG TPA: redoxin family protein [Vicinamibacterales bacterium]|jgi:thiol-disulfide isomerase/thioredoxin|nr:redoxin family protein [Vicinamibacterales bacterium]
MRHRFAVVVALCLCSSLGVVGTARQLPTYPSAKPGDAGYIAEDPQLARLIGLPAPSITLRSIDGGNIDIVSNYGRKPVYLKLWATYCIPCRAQMPEFERLYGQYGDRMQIVAVNAGVGDDPAKVRSFVAAAKLHMPVAIDDGTLGSWLKMEATPFHVLIGRDGRIAHVGHQDGPVLDAALQRVLGTAVSTRVEPARVNPIAPLKPGDLVPTLDLRGADDAPVRFSGGATARPRAVLFTAVWCESYLKDTEPQTVEACRRTRELVDQLSQNRSVDWLGVVAHLWTTPRSLNSYQTRMKPQVPMAVDSDGRAFQTFGIGRLPAVALVSANGRLVRVVGPDDTDLAAAIEKLAP